MTRFNITLEKGIDIVSYAISNSFGGEILIPKLKSFKILDLAKTMNMKNKIKIIGLRQGENTRTNGFV